LIRYLGVTNFDTAHLRMALTSGIQITTNQVSYSLLDQRAAGAKTGSNTTSSNMTTVCLEFGVHLLAFGTLAGGFLTEKWLDQPEPDWDTLETWSLQKYGRYIRQVGGWARFQTLLSTVSQIAQRHDVSMANVACRYILDQPAVAGIIIGARLGESSHVEDNRRLALLELDADCHSQLQAAFSFLLPLPGDCGDEYRKPPYLTASGDLSHHLPVTDKDGSLLPLVTPYPTETISIPTVNAQGQATTIQRMRVSTSTTWEAIAGYSRAVREGLQISVSGTTATHGHHVIGGTDPVSQTHFVIDKIEGCIQSLGGRLEHVVRTRIYVPNIQDGEAVARVHGERFDHIWPVNTLVQAGLVGSDYLVEMEAEAIVQTD
jgi:enamine deaminase RidA (YjgF/YER057c/UK114 family)